MIYIGSIFINDNYDIIVFYIIVLKQLNTAAVSIFLRTGLCTGWIDLGHREPVWVQVYVVTSYSV